MRRHGFLKGAAFGAAVLAVGAAMAAEPKDAAPLATGKRMMTAADYRPERADGRTAKTMTWAMMKLRAAQGKVERPYLKDRASYEAWRAARIAEVKARYRLDELDKNPTFKLLASERRDGYTLKTYEFYPYEKLAVKAVVLYPDGAKPGRTPVVVCVPGTAGSLEMLAGEKDPFAAEYPIYPIRDKQCWWYAKSGMIAVGLENVANANNATWDMAYWKSQLKCREFMGKVGLGDGDVMTREIALCINFLKHDPNVDKSKIAVSGLSLGALVISSLVANDDVAACVYNDFVCDGNIRRMTTTDLPSGVTYGSCYSLGEKLFTAPKHILYNEGGANVGVLSEIRRTYELMGCPGNVSVHYYDKYATPESRKYDNVDMRTAEGLTSDAFFEAFCVDPDEHSVHFESALPWLCKLFYGKWEPTAEILAELERAKAEKPADVKKLFPPDGLTGRKCAPLRQEFTDADFVCERPDGRTEKTMVWAKMEYDRLKGGSDASARAELVSKFKLLETRKRDGYTVEVYEFYPEKDLAVKTMFLIPDKAVFCDTPLKVVVGEDGESVEAIAGEPDPYGCTDSLHRGRWYAKHGKIAVALALPGVANGAPDDVNSADSRAKYLALLPGTEWTDEKLIETETSLCTKFIRSRR